MHTVIDVLLIISSIGLIVIIMFQTTKSESAAGALGGGGLGWGTIGGKSQASVNVPVGIERILNPLTHWFAVTFFVTAVLSAVAPEVMPRVLPAIIPVYIIAMIGAQRLTEWFKSRSGVSK